MAEIERDTEEELGVDSLVPRRSNKHGIDTHYNPNPTHTVFDSQQGPLDGFLVEIFEGEEDEVEQGENVNGRQPQGSETLNGLSRMEFQLVSDALPAENIADHIVEDDSTPKSSLETDLESLEIQKDESTSITATAKTSNGDQFVTVNSHSNGTKRLDESAVIEEFMEDYLDFDVERVLKKQETHDLFCPNCNSCITKRVILRRRKRKIQEISSVEEIVIPEPSPQEPVQDPSLQEPEIVEDTSGDAFRCLSCFSIFIPIGRGFKIFGFGGRGLKVTDRVTPQLTTSDAPASVPEADPGTGEDQHLGVDTVQERSPLYSQPELYPEQGVKLSSLPPAEQEISMAVDPDTKLEGVNNISGTEKQVDLSVVQEQDQTVITVKIPTDTSAETSAAPSAIPATDGGDPQIDIIKSMVYGGMLEAIASLSVVTSAAGADAKTLNIVALGAANMFGGLFILAHNLRVLKHETSEERYEEVLGRPGHFTLHSVVAVLSYLVFGLLPPVIYGFTFRESDNRDYKLIAVAMASLVCIIILALGKSYTRRPPTPKAYMKTLVYYVSLWIMVCGVSYAAGDLLDLLLQKLGWFESSSSVAMPVGEFRPVKMPWASI